MSSTERLGKILNWASANVDRFDMLIGDYVHRHNYEAFDNDSADVALRRSLIEGSRAAVQIQSMLTRSNVNLILGSDLRYASGFVASLSRLKSLFGTLRLFRDFVEQGVEEYLARRHPDCLSNNKVHGHCVAYQLEELAMFELLADEGYDTFIYAGSQLPIMKAIATDNASGVSDKLKQLRLVELRLFEGAAS